MTVVNMHEAKTQLSRLVDAAIAGEEVVIARAGKPLVRLVVVQERKARTLGGLEGKIWIGPDFDEPLPDEVLDAFEGGTTDTLSDGLGLDK